MVSKSVRDAVARYVAGDIVCSDNIGAALRKWREIFGVLQVDVAKEMNISPSVISDYEKGRRVPGARFVKKFVESLLTIDARRGWPVVARLAKTLNVLEDAVIDMREFEMPIMLDELVTAVNGVIISSHCTVRRIYGYTILDSLRAIETLSGNDFYRIMGLTTERALIFTKVSRGRSPLVAVRVSPLKPLVVVIHGTKRVDYLAVRLADSEGIPLILSLHKTVEELVSSLQKLAFKKLTRGLPPRFY